MFVFSSSIFAQRGSRIRVDCRQIGSNWSFVGGLPGTLLAIEGFTVVIKMVRFRSLEKPKEDEFRLELSKQHKYDEVEEFVARQLGLDDPSKVGLTSHNCYSQQPKPQPIKYRGPNDLQTC